MQCTQIKRCYCYITKSKSLVFNNPKFNSKKFWSNLVIPIGEFANGIDREKPQQNKLSMPMFFWDQS